MALFNPLDWTMALATPARVVSSAWMQHVPFAFAIMECHTPRLFVELGTHTGMSYCAFCQAVEQLNLPTRCYAVDTWKGDEHSGFYGEEVFEELSAYHNKCYADFSSLLRMRFDDALEYFNNGTIDLLHIDGCHTYECVRHDFETWLPKLSSRGVVLLHDTSVKEREFGIWRYLEELASQYRVFEFTHCYGLGVIAVGPETLEEPIGLLFAAPDKHIVGIRRFFSLLGDKIIVDTALDKLNYAKKELEAQLAPMAQLQAQLAEKDGLVAQLQAQLAEKDWLVAQFQAQLTEKDGLVAQFQAQLTEKDGLVAQFQAQLTEKDGLVAQFQAQIAEKDGLVAQLQAQLTEKDGLVAQFQAELTEKDGLVAQFQAELTEKDGLVAQLRAELTEKDGLVAQLQAALTEKDGQIAERDLKLTEASRVIANTEAQLVEREAQICAIQNSRSWRLLRLIARPVGFFRR